MASESNNIDDLEGASHWQDIQLFSFTRWVNSHVQSRGYHVTSLQNDLKDGIVLVNLLECISGKSLGRWNRHPRINAQKVENLVISLDFIQKEGVKLVNIGAGDIADGNLRCVLGLIWTLILRFVINRGDDKNARDELLEWVRSKIPEYDIKGFKKDWNDGRAVCALVDALRPGTCPKHQSLDPRDQEKNCGQGIGLAEDYLGVAPLVTAREMANPRVDEKAMMAYIAQFRNAQLQESQDEINARNTRAHGPGLQNDNVAAVPTFFWVDVRGSQQVGRLSVSVAAPEQAAAAAAQAEQRSESGAAVGAGCSVQEEQQKPKAVARRFRVDWTPAAGAGLYRIQVTLAGLPIPGSEFQVLVLAAESLGGEGMIRVFFSTTSSNQKGRADFFHLQKLFEAKKIHLRKDFEPWIAVDLMEKEDREAVFRKAGTRALPIVFVDDEYRGDYDAMKVLEELGKLDELLAMGKRHELVSVDQHLARMKLAAAGGKIQQQEGEDAQQQQQQQQQQPARRPAPAKQPEARAVPQPSKAVDFRAQMNSGSSAPVAPVRRPGKPKFCGGCGAAAGAGAFCGDCGSKIE